VVAVAGCFHDQPPVTPEEVDQIRTDADIDLRHGQVMTAAESQAVALEIAASAVLLLAIQIIDRQAENVRLADRAAEFLRQISPGFPPFPTTRRRSEIVLAGAVTGIAQ